MAHAEKKLGPFTFKIDRPKGTVKKWKRPDGSTKEFTYPVSYGFLPRTRSEDGEGLDFFVGDDPSGHMESFLKMKRDGGRFVPDETKFIVGVGDKDRETIYKLYGNEAVNRKTYKNFDEVAKAAGEFKTQRKSRYSEKTAADDEDKRPGLALTGAALLGGGLAVSRGLPLAAGRETFYHGTAPNIASKIKREGLKPSAEVSSPAVTDMLTPDIRDQAKKLVYLDANPSQAAQYAGQAEYMAAHPGVAMGDLSHQLPRQRAMIEARNDWWKHKGLLRADVPTWKKEIAERFVHNPEAGASFEDFLTRVTPDIKRVGGNIDDPLLRLQLESMREQLDQAKAFKGNLGSEYIRGGKGYTARLLKDVPGHLRARPLKALGGVGLAAAGLGLGGYGLKRLYDRVQQQEKVAGLNASPTVAPNEPAAEPLWKMLEEEAHEKEIDRLAMRHVKPVVTEKGRRIPPETMVREVVKEAMSRTLQGALVSGLTGAAVGGLSQHLINKSESHGADQRDSVRRAKGLAPMPREPDESVLAAALHYGVPAAVVGAALGRLGEPMKIGSVSGDALRGALAAGAFGGILHGGTRHLINKDLDKRQDRRDELRRYKGLKIHPRDRQSVAGSAVKGALSWGILGALHAGAGSSTRAFRKGLENPSGSKLFNPFGKKPYGSTKRVPMEGGGHMEISNFHPDAPGAPKEIPNIQAYMHFQKVPLAPSKFPEAAAPALSLKQKEREADAVMGQIRRNLQKKAAALYGVKLSDLDKLVDGNVEAFNGTGDSASPAHDHLSEMGDKADKMMRVWRSADSKGTNPGYEPSDAIPFQSSVIG